MYVSRWGMILKNSYEVHVIALSGYIMLGQVQIPQSRLYSANEFDLTQWDLGIELFYIIVHISCPIKNDLHNPIHIKLMRLLRGKL